MKVSVSFYTNISSVIILLMKLQTKNIVEKTIVSIYTNISPVKHPSKKRLLINSNMSISLSLINLSITLQIFGSQF